MYIVFEFSKHSCDKIVHFSHGKFLKGPVKEA